MTDPTEEKSNLRTKIREKRQDISEEDRLNKEAIICERLAENKTFQDAKTILFYVSTKKEVDTHALIHKYLPHKTLIVPTIDQKTKNLELFHLKKWKDLTEGHFGILEIQHNERVACHPDHIDVIIVPGLAFDKSGHRLGYGKGYYDQLIKDHPAETIGLAFDLQIVPKVPTMPHDIPIKTIITESQIITP